MEIKYLLLFPVNFAYHILAQLNYEKEWGPASLYSKEYIKEIGDYKELALSNEKKITLENNLSKYFSLLSFSVLRPWYDDFNKLISDFSDSEFINKKVEKNPAYSYEELANTLKIFCDILIKEKDSYSKFWEENENDFLKKTEHLKEYTDKIIKKYFFYLKERLNPSIEIKNNYYVFVINSLRKNGRGLEGGCAIGLPKNKEAIKESTRTTLHEITHTFSDNLLKNMGFDIYSKPGENQDHLRKEQFVEYILNDYLFKNNPEIAKKYEYNLITEKIKRATNI